MKLGPWLFLIYLFVISDTIACLIGGLALWKHRNGMTTMLALMLLGVFVHGAGLLGANAFGYEVKPVSTLGFAWTFWTTRAVQSACFWAMILYMIGFFRKRSR